MPLQTDPDGIQMVSNEPHEFTEHGGDQVLQSLSQEDLFYATFRETDYCPCGSPLYELQEDVESIVTSAFCAEKFDCVLGFDKHHQITLERTFSIIRLWYMVAKKASTILPKVVEELDFDSLTESTKLQVDTLRDLMRNEFQMLFNGHTSSPVILSTTKSYKFVAGLQPWIPFYQGVLLLLTAVAFYFAMTHINESNLMIISNLSIILCQMYTSLRGYKRRNAIRVKNVEDLFKETEQHVQRNLDTYTRLKDILDQMVDGCGGEKVTLLTMDAEDK